MESLTVFRILTMLGIFIHWYVLKCPLCQWCMCVRFVWSDNFNRSVIIVKNLDIWIQHSALRIWWMSCTMHKLPIIWLQLCYTCSRLVCYPELELADLLLHVLRLVHTSAIQQLSTNSDLFLAADYMCFISLLPWPCADITADVTQSLAYFTETVASYHQPSLPNHLVWCDIIYSSKNGAWTTLPYSNLPSWFTSAL